MSAPVQVSSNIHELAAEATTTPQMMRVLWQLAADASKNMQKGVSNCNLMYMYNIYVYVYNSVSCSFN